MAPESEEPEASEPAEATIKACMVSDTGGIDDNSFNENAWAGMEQAESELGVEVTFLESRSAEDYARTIDQHVAEQFALRRAPDLAGRLRPARRTRRDQLPRWRRCRRFLVKRKTASRKSWAASR